MKQQDVVIEAAADDIAAVLELLNACGLPSAGLADHQATALVARQGSAVVGCAALELYGQHALLRSVAVADGRRGEGLGRRLVEAALALSRQKGVSQLYLLTETAADFFPRFGFRPIAREQVNPAVRRSVEFTEACPESALAMWKPLDDEPPVSQTGRE
jgi:amino-acid N-acetyltransferase